MTYTLCKWVQDCFVYTSVATGTRQCSHSMKTIGGYGVEATGKVVR